MENISAVEWLLNEMSAPDWWYLPESMKQDITDQAKEMEKQQIKDAWNDGYDKGTRDRIEKISNPVGNAEQYYTETFKSE